MSAPEIQVHTAPAPADSGYDELEVDPWPHIHVNPDGGGVSVRLIRYKGHYPGVAGHYEETERYDLYVHQPGRLMRLLGDTLERRIQRAIETLERRWRLDEDASARAVIASVRYDERRR